MFYEKNNVMYMNKMEKDQDVSNDNNHNGVAADDSKPQSTHTMYVLNCLISFINIRYLSSN